MSVPHSTPLSVGHPAPDFETRDQNGADVRLSELLATKNVALVFFPFAFSGICTGELDGIRDNLERFVSDDLAVLCVSCDPIFSLRAWSDAQGYFFPLVTDFWPHGAIASKYGVFAEAAGHAVRGTFLIDKSGSIVWTQINEPAMARDFAGFDDAVKALA